MFALIQMGESVFFSFIRKYTFYLKFFCKHVLKHKIIFQISYNNCFVNGKNFHDRCVIVTDLSINEKQKFICRKKVNIVWLKRIWKEEHFDDFNFFSSCCGFPVGCLEPLHLKN